MKAKMPLRSATYQGLGTSNRRFDMHPQSSFSPEQIALFWSKVDKTPTCWLWTGPRMGKGYGSFGSSWQAHRFSYALHNGPIPEGMFVCHSCDVRLCVNPDHLWLGTNADNMRDMAAKGRGRPFDIAAEMAAHPERVRRGERNNQAKLTEAQVLAMRAEYAAGGIGYIRLGRKYGVARTTVQHIVKGNSWAESYAQFAAAQSGVSQ